MHAHTHTLLIMNVLLSPAQLTIKRPCHVDLSKAEQSIHGHLLAEQKAFVIFFLYYHIPIHTFDDPAFDFQKVAAVLITQISVATEICYEVMWS